MKQIIRYCSLLVIVSTLLSCEKAFFEEDLSTLDAQTNLEYLWRECDEKYTYFDLKGIDWNAVKQEYAAKIYPEITQDSLFRVLGGMLNELQDGHTNLVSNFNVSFFNPATLGQDNFDWRIIKDSYLPEDFYISGPFRHDFIANKQIGYVRFSQFSGEVSDVNLDFVLERYKDTKGLILDIRENPGGVVNEVYTLLSRCVDQETLIVYSRIKAGPAHDDFSNAEPIYIQPYDGIRYTKKIIVLVDRGTYSAGSFFSLATKAIPNMILMGDTTGGGLGLPNGGQLPNGWRYNFSITQLLDLNKNETFESGVPVDIPVLLDQNDRTTDEVIERAIQELL